MLITCTSLLHGCRVLCCRPAAVALADQLLLLLLLLLCGYPQLPLLSLIACCCCCCCCCRCLCPSDHVAGKTNDVCDKLQKRSETMEELRKMQGLLRRLQVRGACGRHAGIAGVHWVVAGMQVIAAVRRLQVCTGLWQGCR